MIARIALALCAVAFLTAATPSPDPFANAPHVKWLLAQPFDSIKWPIDLGDKRLSKSSVEDGFKALSLAGSLVEPMPPDRVYLKYDPVHRIAAFQRGCCSTGEQGMESVSSDPPSGLPDADLSGVKTDSGIGIGSTLDQVIAIYGQPAHFILSPKPGRRGFVYRRSLAPQHPTCVRDTRLLLDGSTVVGVSLLWAC